MHINGALFTVVGVAPVGFQFPVDAPAVELWVTLAEDSAVGDQRGARMLDAVGRLKPGISPHQAWAQMDQVASAVAQQFPDSANSARTLIEPENEPANTRLSAVLATSWASSRLGPPTDFT